jgi:hypothetical protein
MKPWIPFGVWISLLTNGGVPAETVIEESRIIPQGEFSRQRVQELSKEFLARHSATHGLFSFVIATDARELAQSTRQFLLNSNTISSLRTRLPRHPIAQLIVFDGSALLRYRDDHGYWEHLVAGRTDPTIMNVNGVQHRLLHFHVARSKVALPKVGDQVLSVFFQSDGAVTTNNAAGLARLFQGKTGIRVVRAEVRDDTWFVGDDNFPEVYQFVSRVTVPDAAYLLRSQSAGCTVNPVHAEPLCSGGPERPSR